MACQVKTALVLCVVLMGTLATERPLLSEANINPVNVSEVFDNWMKEHGRTYSCSLQKAKRFAIFKKEFDYIQKFNSQGNHSFTVGLNAFSDMTFEEFQEAYGSAILDIPSLIPSFRYQDFKPEDLPKYWDWRTQGAVTDVKDQGDCDCGSAFATAAAVEGLTPLYNKPYGKHMKLSVQKLIACSKSYGTCCCEASEGIRGAMTSIRGAMTYVRVHGLVTEETFPHRFADDKSCNNNYERLPPPDMKISDYEVVPEFHEVTLAKAVYHQPVVVLHSTSEVFFNYEGGIFMDANGECGRGNISHSSTIVSFGTNGLGEDLDFEEFMGLFLGRTWSYEN